jgi:DNA polymerase III subunit epsilon
MKWFRRTRLAPVRWAVIDCETSGLDPTRDRLLSVGAVAVRAGRVELSPVLDLRVHQDAPSARDNILVHGIGGDAQRAGEPLAQVISSVERFVADAAPVGFHAPFDAAVLRRHGLELDAKWLDLAALLPAFFPDRGRFDSALEDWLAAFGITARARHDALGDAFATAQLLLVALGEARRQGLENLEDLLGIAASRFARR